jgi:hypothetical protein
MSILSNYYRNILDELNGIEPDRPELPAPTEAEIDDMAQQVKPRKRSKPARRIGLMLTTIQGAGVGDPCPCPSIVHACRDQRSMGLGCLHQPGGVVCTNVGTADGPWWMGASKSGFV